MNALFYLKKFLAISLFRQNQTVNLLRLMAISAPLFFLFSNPIMAASGVPGIVCENAASCDCTSSGDVEPPTVILIDPLLSDLAHGDTLYVSCDDQMGFNVNSAVAMDNCDPNPELEFVDYIFRPGDCQDEGFFKEIVCGWVATDECGNKDSIVITFHLIDTIAPVFDLIPDTLTVECDNINGFFPTATDNCDGRLFTTREDVIWLGDCPGEQMIMRTWIAYDACGNSTSEPQILNVVDTRPPVFHGVPSDITIECDDAVPTVANVTATDNCTDDIMVQIAIDTLGDDCYREIIRTWTAADDCGNMDHVTQVITIVDTLAPYFLYQPNSELTVECDQPTPTDNPVFFDNCDTDFIVTMTYDSTTFNCGWEVVKTWTATDKCDNSTTFTQTIFGVDTTNPTFDNPPADETVECDNIPTPAIVTASDNCDTDVQVVLSADTISTLCNNLRIIRTWIATDNCDNESFFTQTINVIDTTAPTLTGVPGDVTIECTETPSSPSVTGWDNCDNDVLVVLNINTTSDDCNTYLERIWTATDDCGNAYSETQVVTITDFTNPVLTWIHPELDGRNDGEVINYECTDVVQFTAADAAATDNCDTAVDITYTETVLTSPNCDADGYISIITGTWTATDDCGNASTRSIRIQVIDTTNPGLIGVPADVTLSCDLTVPNPPVVGASDNCDPNAVVNFTERVEGSNCDERIIRTWTATDACGNNHAETQVITLIDTLAPITLSTPGDITIECSDPIPTDEPVFEDECGSVFTVNESSDNNPTPCGYVLQKTWTATDECGNSRTVLQIITGVDTTPPTFDNAPADATAACDAIPMPPLVTASDNCDMDVEVTFNEDTFGAGNCGNWQVVRTWTAIDNCGNETVAQQVISISDDAAPIFLNMPTDVTIECDEAVPGAMNPDVTDNCDINVDLSVDDVRTDGNCIGNFTILRTWTATDDCGNSSRATQNITALDRTPPVITFVHPFLLGHIDGDTIMIQCDNLVLLDDEDATATDNCSPPTIDFTEEVITAGDCAVDGYFEQLLCTWTATDDCGNQTTSSVVVIVKDDTAPIFTYVPPSADLACGGNPGMDQPIAEDNCDPNVTITLDEQSVLGGCNGEDLIRTWTATDLCGNTTTASQRISFTDGTPPTITLTHPDFAGVASGDIITLDCSNLIQLDENAVTVTDACDDNPDVTFAEDITNNLDCASLGYFTQMLCTWTATDDCGNVAVFEITVRLTDTEAPVLSGVPADLTLDCQDAIPPATTISASDNCDNDVTVTMAVDTVDGRCPGAKIITRIWTATDACGNTATGAQVITQEDLTPPAITILDPVVNVSCDNIPQIPTPTVVDNCGVNPLIGFAENRIDGACQHTYTLERIWTVTDGCGNSATGSQVVNVSDTEAPVINNVPADMSASCANMPQVPTLQATDNCDFGAMVTFAERQTGTSCADFVLIREWTATDACGNSNVYTQNISLTDDTAPVFANVPADGTFECDNIPDPNGVTLTDNCDTDPIMMVDEQRVDGSCSGQYTLTRTWTGTDRCGNQSTAAQVLNIVDNTAPVINLVVSPFGQLFNGATIDVSCNDLVQLDENTIDVEDCDANPDVQFLEDITVSNNCQADGYLTRMICTWIVTDDCGNESQLSITVNIVDDEAPVFVNPPANDTVYTANGDRIPPVPMVTVTDACDSDIAPLLVQDTIFQNDCSYEIRRMWSAIDDCGNGAVHTQRVIVTSHVEVLDVVTRQPDCGMANGVITFFVNGNPSDYLFEWSPDMGTPNGSNNERSGLPEGEYLINVSDLNNSTCKQLYIIQLVDDCITDPNTRMPACETPNSVFKSYEVNARAVDCDKPQPICLNILEDEIAIYDFYVNGELYDATFFDCSAPGKISLGLPSGQNEVIAVNRAEGCTDKANINFHCIETNHITKTVDYLKTDFFCVDLDELPGEVTEVYSIEDENTDDCVAFDLDADCINFSAEDLGTSTICIVACDDMRLCDTTFLTVNVRMDANADKPELVVNNGFSPNADGINDVFTIENIEFYNNIELQVYNRWGIRVVKKKAYNNDWDGAWEGGELPDGTYFYLLKNDGKTVQSGYLTLMR